MLFHELCVFCMGDRRVSRFRPKSAKTALRGVQASEKQRFDLLTVWSYQVLFGFVRSYFACFGLRRPYLVL